MNCVKTDILKRYRFVYNNGRTVDYVNWNSYEPNNAGNGEDCVEFLSGPHSKGQWNDLPCSGHPRPFACQKWCKSCFISYF